MLEQTATVGAAQAGTKRASCIVDTHVALPSSLARMSKAGQHAMYACVSAQDAVSGGDKRAGVTFSAGTPTI